MAKSPLLLVLILALAACGDKEPKTTVSGVAAKPSAVLTAGTAQTLEAGCASCVYEMPGVKGCALAVKVDGKPLLVTGVPQPGHDSGMCEHAITAQLTGQVEGDHFAATTFAVKP